uniref:ATP synthase F(0) complex subunit f, mitochondrial n=1 Tax=Xenopus tropicalis TaxID=8364 RepID=A0A803JWU2_XENTR
MCQNSVWFYVRSLQFTEAEVTLETPRLSFSFPSCLHSPSHLVTSRRCSACDISVIKMADKPVPLAERRLMDIKLGQLPNWLSTRDFTPNGIIASLRKGESLLTQGFLPKQGCRRHNSYFNKYINVKKGGIGGVAMLLAGYVVLSYVWEYDHIKHDRWRKYH